MSVLAPPSALKQAVLLAKYRQDFGRFAQDQLKILTKRAQLEPFALYPYQQRLLDRIEAQRKRFGFVRQIWLKSRQLGTSTLTQGYLFRRTALWPYTNTLVIAHNEEVSQKIFGMTRRFYDNMAPWLRPMVRYDTKSELVFENPNQDRDTNPGLMSRIEVATAKNIHSGAGGTYHALQLTEAARYANAKEIEASVLRAVPLVEGSIVIMESTAHTQGDWFRAQCDAARAGLSHYEFHFIGYNEDPTAWVALEPGETLDYDEDELDLIKTYQLVPEQLKWRRFILNEMLGDIDAFNQENPIDYEDAWVTKELAVFPIAQLRVLQGGLASPKLRGDVSVGGRFLRSLDGPLAIWEEPQEGAMYDIGADVSMGVGADASAAVVTKRPTGQQVAEWHGQAEPGEWAEILANLGYYYHTALINCEANQIGKWTNAELLKRYPNLYLERRLDRIDQRPTRWLGFLTTQQSKRMLVGRAKDRLYRWCMQESSLFPLVRSQRLYDELKTFVKRDGGDTYGGAPRKSDDLVMAWMLALMAGYDDTAVFQDPMEPVTGLAPETPQDLQALLMANDPAINQSDRERPQRRGRARPVSWYGDLDGWPSP